MTYLLDTHYMLWAIADTKKISKLIRKVLVNPENRILVSTISFWELSLKTALGKLTIQGFSPEDLPRLCITMNFEIIHLLPGESSTFYQLKATYHKDTFDRMLIWQAIYHGYTLISADDNIQKCSTEGLMILKT